MDKGLYGRLCWRYIKKRVGENVDGRLSKLVAGYCEATGRIWIVAAQAAAVVKRGFTLRFARVRQEQVLCSVHVVRHPSGWVASSCSLTSGDVHLQASAVSVQGSATAAYMGKLGTCRKISSMHWNWLCFSDTGVRLKVITKHLNSKWWLRVKSKCDGRLLIWMKGQRRDQGYQWLRQDGADGAEGRCLRRVEGKPVAAAVTRFHNYCWKDGWVWCKWLASWATKWSCGWIELSLGNVATPPLCRQTAKLSTCDSCSAAVVLTQSTVNWEVTLHYLKQWAVYVAVLASARHFNDVFMSADNYGGLLFWAGITSQSMDCNIINRHRGFYSK